MNLKGINEKERNRIIFEELPVGTALMNMAVPMIISQLILLLYNIADVFFIGRTNDPCMIAAASLILPVFNVCFVFANIAGTGGGTLIARLLGVGREDEARKVSAFSFYFSIVSSFAFAMTTLAVMRPLLKLLGASSDTFEYARQYATCVIVIGAVPTILSMTLGNLLRNSGYAKVAGFGFSAAGIVNIFLDPLFMFVILPRGNEMLGAGIATALSNYLACAFFLIFITRMKSDIISFSPKLGLPDRESIRSFFGVGIPAAIGPFLFDVDYILIDRLMAAYSDTALAAVGIVLKAERFPLNIGIGLCLGMTPLAAYNYSCGNLGRMRASVRCARRIGIAVGIVSIALYEIFAPVIMQFFINDAATVSLGADFLRARAPATIFMFLCFIYVHYFQGVGHGGMSLLLIVLRWVVFNIPMLFLLNSFFGIYGIVWSQFVSDMCVALISLIIYLRFSKKLETAALQP